MNRAVASHVSALRADILHARALRLLGARMDRVVWRSEFGFALRFLVGGASCTQVAGSPLLLQSDALDPVFFT